MTDVMTLLEQGRLYRESGNPSAAARYLAQAAELEPTSRSVLTELALAHFHSAALGPAEAVARRLVDLDPSDAYAHTLLGRALARQSKHGEAVVHLRLAHAMLGTTESADALAAAETQAGRRKGDQ
ncbi:Tetratricopeptide repeat-containing protein [Actinokineospora alba]|uniref:Tetratricopeptide repeat-containing protein n=1 Tax=Actinokineospora alba TaxID=504798 RepID=A0A1H0VZ03_9PSEU|nr:tetratricopeptide repeat protein [Actinokineospora alba]TDP67087.1 tetratricopeptide repeat protein [Actinokineospora alba]SDJ47147.1 Tetratricopeptide repeat-containing protein [Actinokineospora alba]SDP83513.1 Tetratricopeptide repeat-containing protein [Actinokineospora alba]